MTRQPVRVAVIEVGSRAVRLLVADVRQGRLEPILTRASEARPIVILNMPPEARTAALLELEGIVRAFHTLAEQKGVTDISVFGTEALRRLTAADALPAGTVLAAARSLSAAEEARYAALAALSGQELPTGSQVLVVDQGGGSLDAAAVLTNDPPEILDTASLDHGVDRLLKMFEASGRDLSAYRADVEKDVSVPFTDRRFTGAIALGSVATKCGWLSVSRPPGARYSPRSVHGIAMRTAGLRSMIGLFERMPYPAWDRFRALFDPGNPRSDDLERVVAGAVVLAAFLANSGIDEFVISALGTRHGLALERAMRITAGP